MKRRFVFIFFFLFNNSIFHGRNGQGKNGQTDKNFLKMVVKVKKYKVVEEKANVYRVEEILKIGCSCGVT